MIARKLFALVLLCSLAPLAYASAANIQVTATGSATGNCTGVGVSILTPAQFNTPSNWGSGSSQIGAGTAILVCGTFTGTANTGMLTFQGGGASGNPIVMTFDTGVNFTNPQWGYSNSAAIVINGFNYITLNGTNATIQNTANGSGLAHAAASTGIYVTGSTGVTVKNFTIANICQHTSFTDNVGCQTSGVADAAIYATSNSNFTVQGNLIHDANQAIFNACGSTDSNVLLTQNTIYNVNWGPTLAYSGSSTTACSNSAITLNDVSNMSNWDSSIPTSFHHDPIFIFIGTGTGSIPSPLINANYVHGNTGADATADIFVQQNTGSLTPTITNNLVVNTSAVGTNDGYITTSSGTLIGNTITCNNLGPGAIQIAQASGAIIKDNITSTCQVGILINSGQTISASDYNDWYNLSGSGGNGVMNNGGTAYATVAAWTTALGFDAHSIITNPNLTSGYMLGTGSAATGAGVNLSGLGIAALNTGAPQFFGTGYACGTGCISRGSSGAWDMGAYPSMTSSELIYGTGAGTGQFDLFGGIFNAVFPPTSGPDNFYCLTGNIPTNGLNGYDDIAQGPQTCYNTALANTPTPLGYYSPTATSITNLNNILAGTGGFTQVQCGQIILVAPGVYTDNNGEVVDVGPVCNASNYIQIETADYAFMPAEGTRITPCAKGVTWSSGNGYPQWNGGASCPTNHVASFKADWNHIIPALTEGPSGGGASTTPLAYRRWGPGLEFTRNNGAYGYAVQPTTATPNGMTVTGCSGGVCTYQIGVGDGTTHGGIASTSQSLCCSASGFNLTTGVSIAVTSGAGENLFRFSTGAPVTAVLDDHDLQFTRTYANSAIGLNGAISSITRDASCNVTGTYSFTGILHQSPAIGLTVFVEGVTDASFNMSSGSVALTSYTSTSSTTFSFGYNTGGGSCTPSTSSGGGLVAIGSPTLATCSAIPNNNCNGIMGQIAYLSALVGGFYGNNGGFYPGTNHVIFDRILLTGDPYAETQRGIGLGDTDHIAIIDSYCSDVHQIRVLGGQEGHCIDGAFANNTDANAGTYKIVNSFLSSSGETTLFGGGGEGFHLTQITLSSGVSVTGICTTTCGIPAGTTTQFMAGSTLFPGASGSNGVNQNQTVTCCTTTTNTNDTFTFPVGSNVTCSSSCVDANTNMTIGGYVPAAWEVRRNWFFKPLIWNPLDPTYNGGGPLPSGGLPMSAKNINEFKNGVNVLWEGNACANSWNTVDQLGASLLITPKAQNICASCQTFNIIYRYNRCSNVNVAWGINNALTDPPASLPAYQGNTYVLHDNMVAQVGNATLTCGWTYPQNVTSCASPTVGQTAVIRSSGSSAYQGTPNFILGNVHLFHNLVVGEVDMANTMVVGGAGTNPVASYGMEWKNSILTNGYNNIENSGGAGTTNGTVSITGGTTVTWVSGSQFQCTSSWGAGTFISLASVLYTIQTCTDNTDIVLANPAPNGTSVAYSVGGSCNFSCSGSNNTPACKINQCWNNPNWDYNAVCDNSANTQTWPGAHTVTLAACSSMNFTNYNSAIPLTSSNWGNQFVLLNTSPGYLAADDGTNMGPNIANVNGYTQNVDTLP